METQEKTSQNKQSAQDYAAGMAQNILENQSLLDKVLKVLLNPLVIAAGLIALICYWRLKSKPENASQGDPNDIEEIRAKYKKLKKKMKRYQQEQRPKSPVSKVYIN